MSYGAVHWGVMVTAISWLSQTQTHTAVEPSGLACAQSELRVAPVNCRQGQRESTQLLSGL